MKSQVKGIDRNMQGGKTSMAMPKQMGLQCIWDIGADLVSTCCVIPNKNKTLMHVQHNNVGSVGRARYRIWDDTLLFSFFSAVLLRTKVKY